MITALFIHTLFFACMKEVSDSVEDAIIGMAGRSDRRASSSKAPRDPTDDSVEDQESKRRRIEMQNFNSLQEWNTELDRLKESRG